VLVQSGTITWTPDGVRLTWSVPIDLGVTGFDIEREVDGVVSRANPTELDPCRSCEFIDRTPPAADEIGYVLIVNEISGRSDRVPLGRIPGRRELPSRLTLLAPTPFPVRDEAVVRFALPRSEPDARLELFGVDGRRVVELMRGAMPAGSNEFAWRPLDSDGRRLASGVYLLRLSTSGGAVTTRILVVR
jgi:hypothetical protein